MKLTVMKMAALAAMIMSPTISTWACSTNYSQAHCGTSCGPVSPTPNPQGSPGDDIYIPRNAPYGGANSVIAAFQVCSGGTVDLEQVSGSPPQYTQRWWVFSVNSSGQAVLDTQLVDYVQNLQTHIPGDDCPAGATGCIGNTAFYDGYSYIGSGWWGSP